MCESYGTELYKSILVWRQLRIISGNLEKNDMSSSLCKPVTTWRLHDSCCVPRLSYQVVPSKPVSTTTKARH